MLPCRSAPVDQMYSLTWKETISKGKSSSKQHLSRDRLVFRGVKSLWNSGDFLRQPTPVRLPTARISPLDPMPDAKSYSDPLRRHRTGTWSNGIESSHPTVDGPFFTYIHPRWWTIYWNINSKCPKPLYILRWILTPQKISSCIP